MYSWLPWNNALLRVAKPAKEGGVDIVSYCGGFTNSEGKESMIRREFLSTAGAMLEAQIRSSKSTVSQRNLRLARKRMKNTNLRGCQCR